MSTERWERARVRPRRALYLSSPIGLGHARRDLAIARHLRTLHPDLQVDWLTQDPVTRMLATAGERVHPASAWLRSESAHLEHVADEHDLHVFQALREMDEILVNNFMVFDEVVEETPYDLVIGDEAWEVDHHLHENPELKRFSFAWITDFVGWLPMPDLGEREALLTADYNAEMLEQRARYKRVRDRQLFIGEPDDVVDASFGPGLPDIRPWTLEHYEFPGYVTGFDPPSPDEVARARHELGYGADDVLCVVAVGGSGVGEPLLRRVLEAVPLARRLLPELRFLVVTGPRIDPASLPAVEGADVRGFVPDLHLRLAAADVAVVQGGLTTTMELAAARVPFLYVPLRHHFEQSIHVRHRLERYGAGRCVSWEEARDPAWLAEAVVKEVGTEVVSRPVETGGAERAAAMLAELL
jgi:predicted glycosyltransferase